MFHLIEIESKNAIGICFQHQITSAIEKNLSKQKNFQRFEQFSDFFLFSFLNHFET